MPPMFINGEKFNVTFLNGQKYSIGYLNGNKVFGNKPLRTITVTQTTGGTISVSKTTAYDGETVTISNKPSTGYTFNSYSVSGATLSGSTITVNGSDVTVSASWNHTVYTITVTQPTGGTISVSKTSAYYGDKVTLSQTPKADYFTFSKYTVSGTGASLSGSTITVGTGNVTVTGSYTKATNYALYSDLTTYSSQSNKTYSINKTIPTDYNFVIIQSTQNVNYAGGSSISLSGTNRIVTRQHNLVPYHQVMTTNTAPTATYSGLATSTSLSEGKAYYKSGASWKADRKITYILDRTTGYCLMYVDNTKLVQFKFAAFTVVTQMNFYGDSSRQCWTIKNVRVNACDSVATAESLMKSWSA